MHAHTHARTARAQDMLPSPDHVVGRACLCALSQLAAQLGGEDEARKDKVHQGVRHTLWTYTAPVGPMCGRACACVRVCMV